MLITKTSILRFKKHTRDIDVTEDQLMRHTSGEMIQDVAPHLSNEDRACLISGITPEEWDAAFPEEFPKSV